VEHDYTLLQQVRAKHVSIGITDVVRVQQNNEVGKHIFIIISINAPQDIGLLIFSNP